MPYNYNIPAATDQLSASQSQIQANFQALGAIAGNATNGSFSLNTAPGTGFNYVNFANQGNVVPSTSTNNYIYSGVSPTTGLPELYINYTGGTQQYDMTGSLLSNTPAPASLANGWTSLPSGIILKWGTANCTSGVAFTLPATDAGGNTIPAFTKTLNLQLTVNVYPGGNVFTVLNGFTVTATTFTPNILTVTGTNMWVAPIAGTATLSYFAVGY